MGKTTIIDRIAEITGHTSSGDSKSRILDLHASQMFDLQNLVMEYVNRVEYRGTVIPATTLEAVYHSEGRFYNKGGWKREYVIKDHLGNTRVAYCDLDGNGVISVPGEILQENSYDAFGYGLDGVYMNHANADNLYQYNGKELNGDHGLNWLYFGKRWYDPAIARFPSVDPLIEKFPFLTTYNYASNNPATNIDLHGLQGVNANTIKKFSNDLNENGVIKAIGNFFNFSSMTTGNGEQQETTVHRVNAVAKAIENAKSQAQGNIAKSAEKVLKEGSQVLVAAGEATETIGEGAQLAGSIITPVVPEVGIPVATAGTYAANFGIGMQLVGHVGNENYEAAEKKSLIELSSTGILKPLRKMIDKLKSLTKVETKILSQQVDNAEIILETAAEKKDKP